MTADLSLAQQRLALRAPENAIPSRVLRESRVSDAPQMKTKHRAEIRAERKAVAIEKPARRLAPESQRGIAFKGKS